MILIIGKNRCPVLSARDIFFGMGIITEACEPSEARDRLCARHNAVVAVGRDLGMAAAELLDIIRRARPKIPIIALREDFCSPEAVGFDAVYPGALYCALAVKRLCELAAERDLRAVGDYSLFGLSARAGERVLFDNEELPLTKSEAAVLRTVIAFFPDTVYADVIRTLAFRNGREPSESGVRTHISAINKKLSAAGAELSICAGGCGYTLSARSELFV